MEERRQNVRVSGPFEGHWHGGSGATPCRISDVSLGGCFIETRMQPSKGEETDVTICFTSEVSLTLPGRVAYVENNLGFGIEFTGLSDEQVQALKQHLHED